MAELRDRLTGLAAVLECLRREHGVVFERAQLLERATLEFMESKVQLSQTEYQRSVMPSIGLFEKTVAVHFKVEEQVLFPIYRKKSPKSNEIISELVREHADLFDRFKEYREIKKYDQSIRALNNLMNRLALHARREDILFSSIPLKRGEAASALRAARAIGLPLS